MQETRKDPRAKVLSMTVRYKSATLDEFIEHHSHDVSRGGMFIKTPSPFPPGTLLKFEVRISEEQKVMQGVGRVVWKRDAAGVGNDSPVGMGVKFIKLDDDSKQVIEDLVGKRGGGDGAFEAGEKQGAGHGAASAAAPRPDSKVAAAPRRQGTIVGLGAVKIPVASATPSPAETGGGMFPAGPPAEQHNPEDRTVMRQAAELLKEALREAGGSMEEVTGAGTPAAIAAGAAAPVEPPEAKAEAIPPTPRSPVLEAPAPAAGRPAPAPSPAPAIVPEEKKSSGGSKAVVFLLAAAAIGGAVFFFVSRKPATPETPAEPAAPAVTAQPAPVPPSAAPTESAAAPASAEPEASAAAAESAAPEASASAAPAETPAQKAAREKAEAIAAAQAKKAEALAAAEAKKAEALAAVEAKKAQAAAAAEAKKAEAAAAAEAKKAAAAAAPAPKPAAPAPTPKPAAPKPKPKAAASDNPY